MKIDIYQVEAFTDQAFKGNPAAVCPLDDWLADELMQQIAMENNLSETAFFVPESDGFGLRFMQKKDSITGTYCNTSLPRLCCDGMNLLNEI
jgi:PhzF family phenazine biosynthesis protein